MQWSCAARSSDTAAADDHSDARSHSHSSRPSSSGSSRHERRSRDSAPPRHSAVASALPAASSSCVSMRPPLLLSGPYSPLAPLPAAAAAAAADPFAQAASSVRTADDSSRGSSSGHSSRASSASSSRSSSSPQPQPRKHRESRAAHATAEGHSTVRIDVAPNRPAVSGSAASHRSAASSVWALPQRLLSRVSRVARPRVFCARPWTLFGLLLLAAAALCIHTGRLLWQQPPHLAAAPHSPHTAPVAMDKQQALDRDDRSSTATAVDPLAFVRQWHLAALGPLHQPIPRASASAPSSASLTPVSGLYVDTAGPPPLRWTPPDVPIVSGPVHPTCATPSNKSCVWDQPSAHRAGLGSYPSLSLSFTFAELRAALGDEPHFDLWFDVVPPPWLLRLTTHALRYDPDDGSFLLLLSFDDAYSHINAVRGLEEDACMGRSAHSHDGCSVTDRFPAFVSSPCVRSSLPLLRAMSGTSSPSSSAERRSLLPTAAVPGGSLLSSPAPSVSSPGCSARRLQRDAFVFALGLVAGCAALFAVGWALSLNTQSSVHTDAAAVAAAASAHSLPAPACVPSVAAVASSALPASPPPPPPPFGVVLIVYGNSADLPGYLPEAVASARSYRAHSPSLPIALITSEPQAMEAFMQAETKQAAAAAAAVASASNSTRAGSAASSSSASSALPSPFTSVVRIPPYWLFRGRQWLTRLYVLLYLLPYTHSLVVDSDTFACGDVSVPLRSISSEARFRSYGFAVNSHSSMSMSPDNGVMLVHANSTAWEALGRQWMQHYWYQGITSDDQASLRSAIPTLQRDAASLTAIGADSSHAVGWLSNSLSCRFLPGLNQTWRTDRLRRRYERTLILDGPVYVFHRRSPPAIQSAICAVLNSNVTSLRLLLWKDHVQFPSPKTAADVHSAFELAFSQSQCERKLDGKCGGLGYWQTDALWIRPMPMQAERKTVQHT